jgi:Flp pilus assembly protein TadG
MSGWLQALRQRVAAYRAGRRGASTTEFAIALIFLTLPLLNVVDLGVYAYRRMQVENAAQVAAHAGWAACPTSVNWPATDTTRCPAFAAAVSNAVRSTSLADAVTEAAGSPAEGYYCPTHDGELVLVGTAGTVGAPPSDQPADCSAVPKASNPTAKPADYIQVSVSYPYAPLFPKVSVASYLTTPITRTSWVRLH